MKLSLNPVLAINQIHGPSTLHRSQQHLYPGGSTTDVTKYEKEAKNRNSHILLQKKKTQNADTIT
ncbi:serrate protein [Culex quinquefasciatus]|uniref:Serrate protein n=1 Tax=Culex quinquefasciatus TaxID=7176 RepID=B0XIT2_CULQU|nr:serrate protein [Culex quinquefasciatus]|eukprot:XP_001869554.1 serrate protein [Culex quinquefasciatus]